MSEKYVNVLSCCYNESSGIEKFIESIFNQTYTYVRLFIVDDGSTDDTVAKIEKFHSNAITLVKQQKNTGFTLAFNFCIQNCIKVLSENPAMQDSSYYFSEIAADEVVFPGAFEKRIEYLEKHPETDMVFTGSDVQCVDKYLTFPRVLPQFQRLFSADFNNLYAELLMGNFLPSPLLARMERLRLEDFLLDPKLKHLCDWDVWLSIARNHKIDFLPVATQCMDWDGQNFSAPRPGTEVEKMNEFIYTLTKQLVLNKDEKYAKEIYTYIVKILSSIFAQKGWQ
jgi:alpha-1,3-rhamnosyltransferase